VDAYLAGAGDVGDVQFPLLVGGPLGPLQRTEGLLLHQFRRHVFQDAFTEPAQVVRPERFRLGHEVLLGLAPHLARHAGEPPAIAEACSALTVPAASAAVTAGVRSPVLCARVTSRLAAAPEIR
jgi:hypothetical protein